MMGNVVVVDGPEMMVLVHPVPGCSRVAVLWSIHRLLYGLVFGGYNEGELQPEHSRANLGMTAPAIYRLRR